jgi:ribulose-phosphate 3-epimerase
MAIICPTVLAGEAHGYRKQIERIEKFARRIQIDLSDGIFTPSVTVGLEQLYWPEGVQVDIHLMYKRPNEVIDAIILHKPDLIIIHQEIEGSIKNIFSKLDKAGIKKGIALLAETSPKNAKESIIKADHVLIFAGHLGYFGGEANMKLLSKVAEIRAINKQVEIGWDGGASNRNVLELIAGGVDVINVGSYIQRSPNPIHAYAILEAMITG